MKTILLLTDFSESANHAMQSAVTLCSKLQANLFLLNNLIAIPVVSYGDSVQWVTDDLLEQQTDTHNRLEKLADQIEQFIDEIKPGLYKPKVSFDYTMGALGENIKTAILKNDIELIVMGASADSTLDHILNGSKTSAVIDHSNRPIIVIPPNSNLQDLEMATLATDLNEWDINAIEYLAQMGAVLNFRLEIVHVDPLDKKGYMQEEKEKLFKAAVDGIKAAKISFRSVKGKDVVKRLIHLCAETGTDLLAVIYYHQSFFTRMLHQSTAKKVLTYQKIPLMIIPSNMSMKA